MTKVEDLAAIGRQMDRIEAEVAALHADMVVLRAMLERLEGSILAVRHVVRELA